MDGLPAPGPDLVTCNAETTQARRGRVPALLAAVDAERGRATRHAACLVERDILFRDRLEVPLAPHQGAWFEAMEALSTAANKNDVPGAVRAAAGAAKALEGVRQVCVEWVRAAGQWREGSGFTGGSEIRLTPQPDPRPWAGPFADSPLLRWAGYVEQWGELPGLPFVSDEWQRGPHFLLMESLNDPATPEGDFRLLFRLHPLERVKGCVLALATARVPPPPGYVIQDQHRPMPTMVEGAQGLMAAMIHSGSDTREYLQAAAAAIEPPPRPYAVERVPTSPPPPRPPSPAWDPSGDPLHFIIELYDVLRGGYDRFLSLRPGDPRIAGERQALERLRHEVHRHIIHGPVRDAVVNRAVECLTRHYIERGQAYDPSEVTNLIGVGVMSPLMGLATLPPVHHADILGKRSEFDSEEARREWTVSVHRHTTQGECLGMGLQSRAELLTRMASLASSPADLQVRGVNGPGVVPFCTLPAVVPTYESGCVSRSGVEDEARRKGATPASDVTVAARETKQRLSRENRETLIESAIRRLLGSGSDAEKAENAKPITLDRVAEESGLPRPTVYRSATYKAFAKQYGKKREPRPDGKQTRAIPLTDKMLAARPNAKAADPAAELEAAEELQQAEAQYRSSLSDALHRKYDAMSRDEQMMAVNDWRATQFLRACGHVD